MKTRTPTRRANHSKPRRPCTWRRDVGASLCLALTAAPALGEISYDLSGFGTLGGVMSDQDFTYQRWISDSGSINRDTVIGIQLDTQLTDAWGITLQAKAAPSTHSDNAWEPTLTWAFVSWRPSNDWLLRAGRLRVPLLLYSASNDVGTTFDFARLPAETYSVTPSPDINGFSFAKTWLLDASEWTLEGYAGMAHGDWRLYLRDGFPPYLSAGALFQGMEIQQGGLVLSLRTDRSYWRLGLHRGEAQADYGDVTSDYPFVSLYPGIGYYQTLPLLPGPGLPTIETVVTNVLTLGAEIDLPSDVRVIGEFVRRQIDNAYLGQDVTAGYLALLRPTGKWTPYIYWSGMRSAAGALGLYEATNRTRVPANLPSAAEINAAQVVGADLLGAFDQQSVAVGTAYTLTPTSKIKAEWKHVQTGTVSSFVDTPAGEESGGRQLNVFSLSVSFTF